MGLTRQTVSWTNGLDRHHDKYAGNGGNEKRSRPQKDGFKCNLVTNTSKKIEESPRERWVTQNGSGMSPRNLGP